jgi:hypothetical protein
MYSPRLMLGTPLIARVWLLAALTALAAGWPAPGAAAQEPGRAAEEARTAEGQVQRYSEDEVKAAFLFHFATYAEWPTGDPDGEVTFAVLRAPSIARRLERFAQDRSIRGRPVRVRQIRSVTQLDGDQVLFIGASQNRRLAQLIDAVGGPTLVVTDSQDGLPHGAMINFQLVDRRVRFEIALPAAQRAGLTLSSRLLSAAMRVEMSRCYLECRLREGEPERYALSSITLRIPSRS